MSANPSVLGTHYSVTIEKYFDIPLIAAMALKEKQIQQNYRPIIAVHKWFARRPGTLFRGVILAEFANRPLIETFFHANDFPGRVVADPFMGGGTPLIEANRVGCDVLGFDINPMATWIVREEIEHLDLNAYRQAARELIVKLERDVGHFYRTDCPIYGDRDVPVKYFLWVKMIDCEQCGREVDLFPGNLLADDTRHPTNVLVCPDCGELNEIADTHKPGKCRNCGGDLAVMGPAKRNRCACRYCGHINTYPRPAAGPPRHRLFAIEYYNPHRKNGHAGRFFKKPDARDLARVAAAEARWQTMEPCFVPTQDIPSGDETDRLHRWGYRRYRDLFNERQLLGLELGCRLIADVDDQRLRHALATNLSDLLRYQNMLCRYDTMALKSLDIFSIHGFPVGLVQCESNLLGLVDGSGTTVGSGGWHNIIEKYVKAKRYCDEPFETRQQGGRKVAVPIKGEWIGECLKDTLRRSVIIRCADSTRVRIEARSLDAVFTDPPYFGNVQYGELMDFCYVWLRRLVGTESEGFNRESTRSPDELTGNETQARGLHHFTDGLSAAYQVVAHALKPGAPLAFTFHHNRLDAYHAVGVAILDAGLVCSASFPCPAEMGGSIHIHGTGSSIVDTVFVCRSQGRIQRRLLIDNAAELTQLVRNDLDQLRMAGMKPTAGDMRCIVYGHLTRMGVWKLRASWAPDEPTRERLARFAETLAVFGDPQAVIDILRTTKPAATRVAELAPLYEQEDRDAVSF
jgi:putative DNA methylase